MAWIPLLLAGWFVVDVLIVAVLLAVVHRRRRRELPSAESDSDFGVVERSVSGRSSRPTVPVR